MRAIFKADTQKLPAYAGTDVDGTYTIYKILKVNQAEKIDADKLKGLQAEYASIVAQEDLAAYLSSLRLRYKININNAALESKERP